jgi:hypothetical protein
MLSPIINNNANGNYRRQERKRNEKGKTGYFFGGIAEGIGHFEELE